MQAIKISLKPIWVNVPKEREQIYNRIKALLAKAESIANNDNLAVKVRLRAMEVAVKIAQFLEGTLTNAQLEDIEAELDSILKAKE